MSSSDIKTLIICAVFAIVISFIVQYSMHEFKTKVETKIDNSLIKNDTLATIRHYEKIRSIEGISGINGTTQIDVYEFCHRGKRYLISNSGYILELKGECFRSK